MRDLIIRVFLVLNKNKSQAYLCISGIIVLYISSEQFFETLKLLQCYKWLANIYIIVIAVFKVNLNTNNILFPRTSLRFFNQFLT